MKRWIIADRSSLQILSGYFAELNQQAIYGGPWGDTSKTVHVAVPVHLEAQSLDRLEVVLDEHAELQDEEGDTIVDLVPGPIQVAYDSKGQKILNEQGKPTLVSSWEYKPRMGAALKVVSK